MYRRYGTVAFQTYTEFFTHTGHICDFLQNEIWQDRTGRTISKLSKASEELAVNKLKESLDFHHEMEVKQNQALDNQAAIIDQDRQSYWIKGIKQMCGWQRKMATQPLTVVRLTEPRLYSKFALINQSACVTFIRGKHS